MNTSLNDPNELPEHTNRRIIGMALLLFAVFVGMAAAVASGHHPK